MSFKRLFRFWLKALILGSVLSAGLFGQPVSQPLDCLLARVNDRPVTLADIKILDAFGLYDTEIGQAPGGRQRAILEKIINLKIVSDLVRERVTIPPQQVESARREALARLEPGRAERALARLGLGPNDLLPYFEEKLIYHEIISLRFSRGTIVTLKEIETYYREVYGPALEKRGEKPRPVLEALGEIEALLKEEKIARQVDSWVKNLRSQAEVQIFDSCLNALDKEQNRP
jgi:hypothetical protein